MSKRIKIGVEIRFVALFLAVTLILNLLYSLPPTHIYMLLVLPHPSTMVLVKATWLDKSPFAGSAQPRA